MAQILDTPGLNENVKLDHFTQIERNIIDRLSHEWYITHGGASFTLGNNSSYKYFLVKPTSLYQEMFNLEREIIVIFSPYGSFEPRTLDAIEYATRKYQHQPLRLEKVCSLIISKDNAIESKLKEILKTDTESQVIIPFTYDELISNKSNYLMRNRFKSHFYTRDLFAFENPLKSDLYFFGRTDLIHSIANRHKSNENSALFGLRKTGKTSVIFGVQRVLTKMEAVSVFIDCQNTAFHRLRWNKALFYIISETKSQLKLTIGIKQKDKYTEEEASLVFEKELLRINEELGRKNLLIIFDEIENITFGISSSEHWEKENDFIYFWQTLRSLCQKLPNIFSYLIVGTNSTCVESPTINGKDNPIFNQVPFTYIEGFDVQPTREMIRKLGRLMGLIFDEIIYAKLKEDFGGHPFLMRHVCSVIHRISDQSRPVIVDKTLYERAKKIFNNESINYVEMLIIVLKQFYADEYEMLKYLAMDELKTFNDFADMSPHYTNHLLGYGIIEQHNSNFSFRIEALREYLLQQHKYKKLSMTNEERWQEISERRNSLEQKLRKITKIQLQIFLGKTEAKANILDILGGKRKAKYSGFEYEDLFNVSKIELYFEDIRKIIIKNWEYFKNTFSTQQEFDLQMQVINRFRVDAHAKPLQTDDMELLRVCITSIEKQVDNLLS